MKRTSHSTWFNSLMTCFVVVMLFWLAPLHASSFSFPSPDIKNIQTPESAPPMIIFAANHETANSSSFANNGSVSPLSQTADRTRAIVTGTVAAVGLYGTFSWWQQGVSGKFRTDDEGWFRQDTYAGGADKLGHAFSAYAGTRLLKRGFEWAGNDPEKSLWLAATTTFGTLLAVEVADGFSKEFSFSKGDFVMNTVGVGLGLLFEKQRSLDNLFDFRVLYWPSSDARRLNRYNPIADYSGQTYLLIAKAAGVPSLRRYDGLKYVELAIGYGSRGYEPSDGITVEHSRHGYLGISINLSEVLNDTVFRNSRGGRAQQNTNTLLEYLQIPGTALLADHTF